MRILSSLAVPALLLVVNGAFGADEGGKPEGKGKEYTLATSAVDGKPLGDKPVSFVYKGHEIKVVDEAEKTKFMADADANLKKVEKAEHDLKKEEKKEEHAEKKAGEKAEDKK
jgi:hypothetical protein